MSTETNPTQKVTFAVETTAGLGGLDATLTKLRELDGLMDTINAKFSGRAMARKPESFLASMGKNELGVDALAKQFGLDPNGIREQGMKSERELRKQLDALNRTAKSGKKSGAAATAEIAAIEKQLLFTSNTGTAFRSKAAAARGLAEYEKSVIPEYKSLFRAMAGERGKIQSGGPAGAAPGVAGGQVASGVTGTVSLNIPAAQIEAKVVGPISLAIPGSQVSAAAPAGVGSAGSAPAGKHIAEQFPLPVDLTGPGTKGPASAKRGPASAGGGGGGGKVGDVRHMLYLEKEEMLRGLAAASKDLEARSGVYAKTAQQLRAVMQSQAARDLDPEVFEKLNQRVQAQARTLEARSASTLGGGHGPIPDVRQALGLIKEDHRRALIDAGRDDAARATAYTSTARRMRETLGTPRAREIDAPSYQALSDTVNAQARTMEAQARVLTSAATGVPSAPPSSAYARSGAMRISGGAGGAFTAGARGSIRVVAGTPTPPVLVPPVVPPPIIGGALPGGGPAGGRGGVPGLLHQLYGGNGRLVTRGLTGFTPAGFTKNLLTVGGWTAAVGALYTGVGVVKASVQSFVDLERATKRLDQVFRGGGGTARELADDILRLAAANGQSSKEAIASGIAWSRTGMNRVQVNEAVKVSLMAANVAEMDASEATESLSAVMTSYGLSAGDLAKVLGQVNHTSNTLRVTNRDLFEGLARTSAVARQAQLPLEKLIPIIGTAVAATGQTGNQFGNAMKTVLVRLGTPELQQYLRSQPIGIETQTPGGGMRPAEDVLAEAAAKFKTLSGAKQAQLVSKWGSATQANRLLTFFQQWNHSMTQSAENLKNLDSAEKENELITASLDSRWKGLVSSWDRLVLAEGSGPVSMIGDKIKGAETALTILADSNSKDGGLMEPVWDLLRTINSPLNPQNSPMYKRMVKRHPNWDVASGIERWWRGGTTSAEDLSAATQAYQSAALSNITSEHEGRAYLSLLAQSRSRFSSGGAADALAMERSNAIAALGGDIEVNPESQAALRALANPQLTALARLTDRRSIAAIAASQEAAGMSFGSSPGEQLVNQRTGLIRELSALGQSRDLSDNDIVRQLSLQLELLRNQEAIQQRIAQVEAERRQIQIDSTREFQRSLITAGPQELLQKMAVNQMWSKGKIGAHNFFALSPSARSTADQLMGGEAMRQNRFDADLLGPAQPLSARQNTFERITDDLIQFRERLSQGEEKAVARSLAVSEGLAAGLERMWSGTHVVADGLERLGAVLRGITAPTPAPAQSLGAAPGVDHFKTRVSAQYTVG